MGSHGEVAVAVDSELVPKPHVVVLAIPSPGHFLPFLAFGETLARHGVKVTFLCSGIVSETLRREVEKTAEDLDMSLGSVVEDPIPEPENPRDLVPWLSKFPPEEMTDRTAELVQKLSPPPCLLIVDVYLPWSAGLEAKLSIPRHFLVTMSAASLAFMFSVPLFAKQGLLPLDPGASSELNAPGVGNVAHGDVWEYFIKGGPAQMDSMIELLQSVTEYSATAPEAATYLINSVDALEPEVFDALKAPIPFTGEVAKVVSIGPLETAFATKEAAKGDIVSLEVIESKECQKQSSEVVRWLDTQPTGSVVYISFGSIFSLKEKEILELAHALESSGKGFLWVLRPPESPQVKVSLQGAALREQVTALLPPGFEERTKGRGLLYSSWVPQPKILAHKAVGCFVSHCGWNSLLEAIATCTPILACPCFVDQWLNATFVEKRFRIGRMMKNEKGEYERGRIESLLRGMMTDAAEERKHVVHMNQLLREAVTPSTGSSDSNLRHYVSSIFTLNQQSHQTSSPHRN